MTPSATPVIRFDWAIKTLLRNKANFDVLEGFLSTVLSRDIVVQGLLESETNQLTGAEKFSRFDLLAEDSDGDLMIIEVQNSMELDYFQRMVFGTAQVLTEHLATGSAYGAIRKVIAITIAYFDLGQGDDYVYHGQTCFVGKHTKDVLALSERQKEMFGLPMVADIFPEYWILKVERFDDQVKDALDEWMWLLKHSEVKQGFRAKGMVAAANKLAEMNLAGRDRALYRAYCKQRSDLASAQWTQEILAKEEIAKAQQEAKEAQQEAKEAQQEAKEAQQEAKEAQQEAKEAQQEAKEAQQEAKEAQQEAKEAQQELQRVKQEATQGRLMLLRELLASGMQPPELVARGLATADELQQLR